MIEASDSKRGHKIIESAAAAAVGRKNPKDMIDLSANALVVWLKQQPDDQDDEAPS